MSAAEDRLAQEFEQAHSLYCERRYTDAFNKYRDLAERGYSNCQMFVGWMYLSGKGVEKDLEQSEFWLSKAAERDDVEAQFYLGKLSATKGDYASAIKWYEKSASHGYAPSIYKLGVMCDQGKGVSSDEERAIDLYEKAASAGHIYAKKAYAVKLLRGKRGFFWIIKGLFLYITVGFVAARVAAKDMDDERLRT